MVYNPFLEREKLLDQEHEVHQNVENLVTEWDEFSYTFISDGILELTGTYGELFI